MWRNRWGWLYKLFRYWYTHDLNTKLEFDNMSGATLTLNVGDNTHSAVATNTNLDGSPATGVTVSFSSSDPGVCSVDATTGALTPLTSGSANISETSSRGLFSHNDFGTVTVVDPNTGDFTTALTFS